VRERLERGTIVHDWIPEDTRTLNKLVRLIYLTDPVAGPAIDFYREVPFGPVALGGIRDEKRLQFYTDALDALHLERHTSYLAGDILVDGRLIVHLLLNESKGYFTDLIVHDSDFVEIQHSPIQGEDPLIDLIVPEDYRIWATSADPRIKIQRAKLDPRLVKLMAAGASIPLSPANTIFVPRKMSANDHTGTSLIMRVLPIIAVEWAYLAAEVTGMRRRAAPWTIATVGIEDKWEPTPDEMLAIQDMLVAAEEDPVGAKLIFRNGVDIRSEGGPGDHAKWLEHWSTLKEAKLQGLGMNEAFATGEASWCLPGSSLIATSKGLLRMKDIPNYAGLSLAEAKRIGTISLEGSGLKLTTGKGQHLASAWAYSGKKQVKRITTDLGYTLDGTNEHPVLVLTSSLALKWTQIKDLKEGDVIALKKGGHWPTQALNLNAFRAHTYEAPHIAYRRRHARGLKEPHLPTTMSNELACLLGYLVSEGDCTDRNRFIFGNTDPDVLEHYKECHRKVFPNQHLSYDIVESSNKPFTSINTGSWIVREFLDQLGLTYAYSAKKEIPWCILQSPKIHVAKFLSALFEGDGSATHGIEYWSCSRKLINQVQQLLLKFDIISKAEPQGLRWRLRIFGRENIQSFINEIDFVSTQKKEAVRELLCANEQSTSRRRWKHLGAKVKQCVSTLLNKRSYQTRYLNRQGDVVCAAVRKWRLHVVTPHSEDSRFLLEELEKVDPKYSRRISLLWELPYIWDGVDHIGDQGIKSVYDLRVPEHESYVANGFVVHNSYLESMLSLGMERIRNFRSFIAREVIQQGILTPLAKLHGFYKTSQADIDHRIRTGNRELDIPTVEWGRSLQPTADRDYLDILQMLEEKGIPITLRKWAQAGGYDLEEGLSSMDSDIELRKNLQDYKQKLKAISLEGSSDTEDETEGEARWGSAYLADKLASLPLWDSQNEFLDIRKSDLPRLTQCVPPINGNPLGLKAWKKAQAKLRTAGVGHSQQQAFQFLLRRAQVTELPVDKELVVRVRDQLLRRNAHSVPDRAMMKEINFLNHELERKHISDPQSIVPSVLANSVTAPWVRPATPKLLTGEGYEGS